MTDAIVPQLTARFNELSQKLPDEGIEFWFARDLMEPLGYARWENFVTAIQRAIGSCKSTGYDEGDHFRGVTKMVRLGSSAERSVDDFMKSGLWSVSCLSRSTSAFVTLRGSTKGQSSVEAQGAGLSNTEVCGMNAVEAFLFQDKNQWLMSFCSLRLQKRCRKKGEYCNEA